MPFKSKAQQEAMYAKADKGEIDKDVVDEFSEATKDMPGGFASLPERKGKNKGTKDEGKGNRPTGDRKNTEKKAAKDLGATLSNFSGLGGGVGTLAGTAVGALRKKPLMSSAFAGSLVGTGAGLVTGLLLEAYGRMQKTAALELDIDIGDTILTGRFKNSPKVVKSFGTDEKGQPTVNGMKLLACRIEKLMPGKKEKKAMDAQVSMIEALKEALMRSNADAPPRRRMNIGTENEGKGNRPLGECGAADAGDQSGTPPRRRMNIGTENEGKGNRPLGECKEKTSSMLYLLKEARGKGAKALGRPRKKTTKKAALRRKARANVVSKLLAVVGK